MEQGHELRTVEGLDDKFVQKLAGQWINTAEELLSAAATPEGRGGLLRLLDLDKAGFDAVLDAVKGVMGEEESRDILEGARPGGPLGSRLTEEQKERLGVESDEAELEES